MKLQKPRMIALVVCLTILIGELPRASAQRGTSSAAVGFARAGVYQHDNYGRFVMPAPNMFRVEEFINYHEHALPMPEGDDRVSLDVRKMELSSGRSVMQFGITTPSGMAEDERQAINLVFVVDESGSMSGEKNANLKRALHKMVDRFCKSDRVAIVGFENSARVILPATKKAKASRISKAIDSIRSGGGTNLHAGLMLGYRVALEHYDSERANRVIFLTDGNANVGETESNEIARKSDECIDQGISLVTIGLGVDFNHGLLRELADSGRGTFHFINDARDIEKTFVNEVESLLAPIATNVKLRIDFEELDGAPKFYGYENHLKQTGDCQFVLKLDSVNRGVTQVVVAKIACEEKLHGVARLTYLDAESNEKVELRIDLAEVECQQGSMTLNRNYAIALIASSLRSAAEESNAGNCKAAERRLRRGVAKATKFANPKDDKHVKRIAKIANNYRTQINRSRNQMANRD